MSDFRRNQIACKGFLTGTQRSVQGFRIIIFNRSNIGFIARTIKLLKRKQKPAFEQLFFMLKP